MRQEDMRKLATLIALLAIISLALPSAATAGRRWQDSGSDSAPVQIAHRPADKGSVASDHAYGCVDILTNDSGHSWSQTLGQDISGVQAWIDPADNVFEDCGPIGSDLTGSASIWVGLEGDGPWVNEIVQVGLVDCHDPFNSACSNTSTTQGLRYFYAFGGCGIYQPHMRLIPTPALVDIRQQAGFMIQRTASWFYFYIDYPPANGVWVQVAAVPRSDDAVDCWDDNLTQAEVAFERHDDGDSAGLSTQKTRTEYLRYSLQGLSGWNLFSASMLCVASTIDDENLVSCQESFPTGTNRVLQFD